MLGSLLNVRQNLGVLAASIANHSNNRFAAALQGLRLALMPRFEGSDAGFDSRLTSGGAYNIGGAGELFDPDAAPAAPTAYNVRAYTVGQNGGVGGAGPFQGGRSPATMAVFRSSPITSAPSPRSTARSNLQHHGVAARARPIRRRPPAGLGTGQRLLQLRRAFLIVDPPSDNNAWTDVNQVTDVATGITSLRIGVTTDHAAVYWPRLRVIVDRVERSIDPSGTEAGLYARIDATRGVWKAPAGLEATSLGVRRRRAPHDRRRQRRHQPAGGQRGRISRTASCRGARARWSASTIPGTTTSNMSRCAG